MEIYDPQNRWAKEKSKNPQEKSPRWIFSQASKTQKAKEALTMVARKRVAYSRFKHLWGMAYMREHKKHPNLMPAVISTISLAKVKSKYRFRRVKKNPFFFKKASNMW
jgi:hypothetical protein